MMYEATTIPVSSAASTGSVLFLYEMVGGESAPPPAGAALEDRIQAGSQNAVTIREVTIGGYN